MPRQRQRRTPEELERDAYRLHDASRNLTGFAVLSLRLAVEAFCSTYNAVRGRLDVLNDVDEAGGPRDDLHGTRYHEAFAECVIHFQHFAELVIKDFLRAEHPLLADEASNHHVLLHKLLNGKKLALREDSKLRSIEFSVAFERICALIREKCIDSRIHFVANHTRTLLQLNKLRNRMLHRGTVVLRYQATDEFFGGYVLPFVLEVAALDEYKKLDPFWRSNPLHCGVDVLAELVACCKGEDYKRDKAAFLKELGRAAYANPISPDVFTELVNPPHRRHAEKLVDDYKKRGGEVHCCPVCGIEAALLSYDTDQDSGESFPFSVRCLNCSFEVENDLCDEDMFGLPIQNFFNSGD